MQSSTDQPRKLNSDRTIEQLALESARRNIKGLSELLKADQPIPPADAAHTLDRIGELLAHDYFTIDKRTMRDGFRLGAAATMITLGVLSLTIGLCTFKSDETTSSIA